MKPGYCPDNPNQNDGHCFHVSSTEALPFKDGQPRTHREFKVTSMCCWCADTKTELSKQPVTHGKKARVMR